MPIHFWLDDVRTDVRLAARQLRRAPGFACIAVLTLAVGVGANSAVFALADAALLRPLPFHDPDRLVMLWERRPDGFTSTPAPAEFQIWSARARSVERITAMAVGGGVTMRGPDGIAALVPSQTVTVGFFDVLGVTPVVGRTFVDADVSAAPTAVVLSETLWRRRFGADPAMVGQSLVLSGRAMTVVGVVPARVQIVPPFTASGVATSDPAGIWTLAGSGSSPGAARAHYVHVIARLRPTVPIATASTEMAAIAASLARESPASNAGHGVFVQPLREALIGGEVRSTSWILLAVVGFVLLMCCANVANLLLARTTARAGELAVRTALGAARQRIVAQLLTESLTLALVGGLAGAGLAVAILRIAPQIVPPGLLPNAIALTFDGRVAAFCGVATVLTGVLFGLAPAWHATGRSLARAAVAAGRATQTGAALGGLLVVVEVAAAVLVLSGAGLLLRTWSALGQVDPGYRAGDRFTATVNLPMPGPVSSSRYQQPAAVRRFYEDVEAEVARRPGVRRVAWGSALPLDGWWFAQPFQVEGDPPKPQGRSDTASYHMVTPTYFETLGITIVRGRPFEAGDGADGLPVCIVSEAFARQYLAGREPLGLHIAVPLMAFGPPTSVSRQIVGVARQVKGQPDEPRDEPQLYVPLAQNAWWSASLVVEPAAGAAAALAAVVRAAVSRVDGEIPLKQVRTTAIIAETATQRPRFRAVIVAGFAAMGLALAMVGIFGVLAQAVGRRTREIGVRVALGASRAHVARLVVGHVGRTVGAGTALGLMLAAVLARSLNAFLFGVQPLDPVTFISVTLLLILTAALAAAVPALRAVRIDPIVAFRSE